MYNPQWPGIQHIIWCTDIQTETKATFIAENKNQKKKKIKIKKRLIENNQLGGF